MDRIRSVEKLREEVNYWSNYNAQITRLLEELQYEKARSVRILQQKRAELARLESMVRQTKAGRRVAT